MKTTIKLVLPAIVAAVLSWGCGTDATASTGATGGSGGTGGDEVGGGGTGGGTTTTTTIPWDGSPYLGFGYDGAPCDAQHAFTMRVASGDMPEMASTPIVVPVDGFISGVTVVHVRASATGNCNGVDRQVWISEPTDDMVPDAPAVHEAFTFTSAEIQDAFLYKFPLQNKSLEAVPLARFLSDAMHVTAGQVVHVGSLLDVETICPVGAGTLLDGSDPPTGDAFCTQGMTWDGCGTMPLPGIDHYIAWIAWVDFTPE